MNEMLCKQLLSCQCEMRNDFVSNNQYFSFSFQSIESKKYKINVTTFLRSRHPIRSRVLFKCKKCKKTNDRQRTYQLATIKHIIINDYTSITIRIGIKFIYFGIPYGNFDAAGQ